MKQLKTLALIVIALSALLMVSCLPGTAQPTGGWSGAVVHDGIIYVGSRDGRVVAINSSTQSKQWDYTINPPTTLYTTPIVDGDLVYVGTYNGIVLALNTSARVEALPFPQARYGEWEWYCPLENAKSNAIVADLAMSVDTLYAASSNGRIYSLDKGSGDENWRREDIPILTENPERPEKLWNSPVIQGNTLYVSTFDGYIYALSAETGERLNWSFEAEAGFASSPVIYEDIIYVGSFDRQLYAIRIGSDVPLWKFPQEKPAGNWFWASPIINDGIAYASCLDGKLYAIEAKTGEKLWEFDTENTIVTSPVLMENLLIVAAESGNVYIINPETGVGERIKNRENGDKPTIDARIRASLCAHEDLVYIRGEDNQLYIVDIGNKEVSQPIPLNVEE